MKKLFFVAAATVLALSSCSDNEINSIAVEKAKAPISISVYNQGQTRVTETVIDDLRAGFQFVAYNGDIAWIENTIVSAIGNTWVIGDGDTNYYWPSNDDAAITFYGLYSPGQETISADGTTTINTTATGCVDVVAAYTNASYSTNGSTVGLQFKHINAQVAVESAIGDNEDFQFVINNIVIKAPTSCVYDFATGVTSVPEGSAIANVSASLGLANRLILPAASYDLDINYSVTNHGDTEILTKSTTITPVAGKINKYNITLPHERAAMIITVESVSEWEEAAAM